MAEAPVNRAVELNVGQLGLAWRLAPALRNYVYWGTFGMSVAVRLADVLFLDGVHGCCYTFACSTPSESPICNRISELTYLGPIGIALQVITVDFLGRCYRIWRPRSASANHWVAATSREYFAETVRAVRRLHEIVACGIFLGCGVSIAFMAKNMWTRTLSFLEQCRTGEEMEWAHRRILDICGPELGVCVLTYFHEMVINTFNAVWVVMLMSVVIVTPRYMWQPLASEAMARCGSRYMQRVVRLPVPSLVAVMLTVGSIAHSNRISLVAPGLTRGEIEFHFYFASISALFSLSVAAWGGLVTASVKPLIRTAWRIWVWLTGKVCCLKLGRPGSRIANLQIMPSVMIAPSLTQREAPEGGYPDAIRAGLAPVDENEPCELPSYTGILTRMENTATKVQFVSVAEPSVRQLHLALLMAATMIWVNLPSAMGTFTYGVVGWTLKLLSLVALGLAGDGTMSFDQLRLSGGPGMGLLVSRRRLCRKLEALLAGKDLSDAQDLPTYKASAIRMQETLAISYRWHTESQPLGKTTSIIFSRFQVSAVLAVLHRSSHQYVWIDKLAVYQKPGLLQTTLLSRMMAVYCGAHTVFAIRSCESERSRYHQRAWTLQEYCVAQSVVMVDETPPQATMTGDAEAPAVELCATTGELEFFSNLRREIQDQIGNCRPFWIYGGFTDDTAPEDITRFVARYNELAARVWCQYEGDKLRALWPILANVPVSSQQELATLVVQAERISDVPFSIERPEAALVKSFSGRDRGTHTSN